MNLPPEPQDPAILARLRDGYAALFQHAGETDDIRDQVAATFPDLEPEPADTYGTVTGRNAALVNFTKAHGRLMVAGGGQPTVDNAAWTWWRTHTWTRAEWSAILDRTGPNATHHGPNPLALAVQMLDPELKNPPLIPQLTAFIQSAPEELRAVALTYEDVDAYNTRVQGLLDALISLGPAGPYGTLFSEPTSEHLELGRPAVFDISGVNENDAVLMAAVQSLCWNLGSATVSAESHLAADEGRRRRTYLLVMDELWRVLRASDDMVHFIDAITRLNRGRGIGQIMVTHTMKDLKLSEQHLTDVASGFVERSAMVFLGGLSEG